MTIDRSHIGFGKASGKTFGESPWDENDEAAHAVFGDKKWWTRWDHVKPILGDRGDDVLVGGARDDRIVGFRGDDRFSGLGGDDRLDGGRDDDILIGGPGDDWLIGGGGHDTAAYTSAAQGVSADLRLGVATGDGQDRLTGIENVVGSAFDDTLKGDGDDNGLDGGDGDDTLTGSAGDDELIGGNGVDWTVYTDARKAVTVDLALGTAVGDGADRLSGIEGMAGSRYNDTLRGNASDNWLDGDAGDDALIGGGGDTVVYTYASQAVAVDLALGTARGDGVDRLDGIESAVGSTYGDMLTGDAGNNWLTGGAGDDKLNSGDGVDVARYSLAPNGVWVDLALGTATGEGTDRLFGIEWIAGSTYGDALKGDAGGNWLMAAGGDDRLFGEAGDDVLKGGAGNDALTGGVGRDILEGGAGADTFVILQGTGFDEIRDFDPSADVIDVRAFSFTDFSTLSATFEVSGGDTLIHLAAGDDVRVAGVAPTALAADDFLLVA